MSNDKLQQRMAELEKDLNTVSDNRRRITEQLETLETQRDQLDHTISRLQGAILLARELMAGDDGSGDAAPLSKAEVDAEEKRERKRRNRVEAAARNGVEPEKAETPIG